jgi:hypothetical protein
MIENQGTDSNEEQVEKPVETTSKRLADTLSILRSMAQDAMVEHRDVLIDLPDIYNHLQMIDKHLYNAALEEERSREPVPAPKNVDLPEMASQLAPGEKYLLRSLAKAPNGINKHMLGNENTRLIEWGFILAEGNMLKLSERGATINQLLSLKPSQRLASQALAS